MSMPRRTPRGVYFTGGVDLVSSYLWRGYREAGVSMQPSIALNAGGFKLSAWGSADLTGISYRELDLKATYVLGPVTFSVIDVYCVNPSQEGDHNHNYFSYNRQGAPHRVEAGVAWCISKKVPLTIAWYTTLVGGSDYDENGKRTWASYAQLSYPLLGQGHRSGGRYRHRTLGRSGHLPPRPQLLCPGCLPQCRQKLAHRKRAISEFLRLHDAELESGHAGRQHHGRYRRQDLTPVPVTHNGGRKGRRFFIRLHPEPAIFASPLPPAP